MKEAKTLEEARQNLLREIVRNDSDKADWFLEALEEFIDFKLADTGNVKSLLDSLTEIPTHGKCPASGQPCTLRACNRYAECLGSTTDED